MRGSREAPCFASTPHLLMTVEEGSFRKNSWRTCRGRLHALPGAEGRDPRRRGLAFRRRQSRLVSPTDRPSLLGRRPRSARQTRLLGTDDRAGVHGRLGWCAGRAGLPCTAERATAQRRSRCTRGQSMRMASPWFAVAYRRATCSAGQSSQVCRSTWKCVPGRSGSRGVMAGLQCDPCRHDVSSRTPFPAQQTVR